MSTTHLPTLDKVLRCRVGASPDAPMICDYSATGSETQAAWFSAADIDRMARQIGRRLTERSALGDRVLLCFPPGHAFTAAFFACVLTGRIAVPVPLPGHFPHERRRIAAIADNSGASAVLTTSGAEASVTEWLVEQDLRLAVLAEERADSPGLEDGQLVSGHPQRSAFLQYTSGSTGSPKGVIVSHENVLANAKAIARSLGIGPAARVGGWLPNYHDMGLIGHHLAPIVNGGSAVLMEPMTFLRRPHLWLRMIDEMGIEFSAAPNFAYALCTRRVTEEQLSQLDLSRWRTAVNGSEPVSRTVMEAFSARFAAAGFRPDALVPAYGLAESTLLVSSSAPRRPVFRVPAEQPSSAPSDRRPMVSCGRPTDADLRIVDPDRRTVMPAGLTGEIWLSGGSVAQGYWNAPDKTREVFGAVTDTGEGPFLRTGDVGFIQDGELHVAGRMKEIVIVRGRKLHSHDVEEEIRAPYPELKSGVGAAFSVPDSDGADLLVLVHEVAVGTDPVVFDELASSVRSMVSREFGVDLDALVLVRPGHVQRTTSGKIARAEMRQRFLSAELKAVHTHLTPRIRTALDNRSVPKAAR
ncbi:fatty acyl-AMP ligase [Streptomyces sp. NBC_01092]|uniref:fatty acyl-AMP ligase n=1 Tax=Streptomyces sp. NBC_01092 TaxID=2903748 RepID=UPI00386ECF1D|nr:fatty acyl-AMP ligase [Streptomyces sp. NBC_01092]